MKHLLWATIMLIPAVAHAIDAPAVVAPPKAPVTETPGPAPAAPLHVAAFDPFVATPARLSDGVGITLRFNAIPDSRQSALGTQVSIEPAALAAYKKLGPVSAGIVLPLSFNPDRSKDDTILQAITLDLRGAIVERPSFRMYGGLRVDAALNAGVADAEFPDREVSHTLSPYAVTTAVFGPFAPQLNLAWHHALATKRYAGAFYRDAAKGFALDLVLPYHLPEERLTIVVELNFDRDADHGRNRGWVTPGVRFLPAPRWQFGLGVTVPVIDEAFADAVGIGVITTGGYEF